MRQLIDLPIAEVLELLFDCPKELLPLRMDGAGSGDPWEDLNRAVAAAVVAASPMNTTIADDNGVAAITATTSSSSKVVPGITPGPNRPALQVFTYDGEVRST